MDPLLPDAAQRLARARADLGLGLPVGLEDEGTTTLALAAETVTPERLAALRARGPVVLALTARRAHTLRARAYDGDLARLTVPAEADAAWVRATADPVADLAHPMKGPFASLRTGDARPARAALALLRGARLLPAALLVEAEPPEGAARVPLADALAPPAPLRLLPVAAARVPLAVSRAGRLHVFRAEDSEHVAVEIGPPPRARPVLARLHSACMTGDTFGSLKCDCGPQLHAALRLMGEEAESGGGGVLLYLDQEGRGIGLANKMRAYALQDQGFDTVEANHRLGFEDDERDFRTGAEMLKALGFASARLLTNNPAKVARMEEAGVRVTERVPLRVGETDDNRRYLATKAARSGHLL